MKNSGLLIIVAVAGLLFFLPKTYSDDSPTSNTAFYSSETKKLLKVFPGAKSYPIPLTMYPPELFEAKKAKLQANPELKEKVEALLKKADLFCRIPLPEWQKLIPDRSSAPVTNEINNISDSKCPICGANRKAYVYNFLESPFSLKTQCCQKVLHELPSERTPEEQAEIKGQESFSHYDGKERILDFAESKVWRKEDGSPVRYYPANLVWSERVAFIIGSWGGGVLRNLTDAYLYTKDEKYAKVIVAILKRLAEVFPHYPLACHNRIVEISKQELISAASKHQPLSQGIAWRGPCRLTPGISNFRIPWEGYYAGGIARAFMAVENSPAWGEGEAGIKAKAFVKKNLLKELSLVLSAYGSSGDCVGNGVGLYLPGILALAMCLQDQYFYNGVTKTLEMFLYNSNFYDGLAAEGSLNYARMVSGTLGMFESSGLSTNPSYRKQNPFLKEVGKSQEKLTTLRGVPSQHGDGPNGCFMAKEVSKTPNGEELQLPSVAFGGYGLSILRQGSPGHQMEIIFSHDRVTGHAHDDTLGIQFFYQGVPLLNYFGDSRISRFIDMRSDKNPAAAKLLALEYPEKIIKSDMNRKKFQLSYASSPLAKNTLVIDEYDNQGRGAWNSNGCDCPYGNLFLFKGGEARKSREATFQIAEASGENMFKYHNPKIRLYSRALIAVSRPDGKPYAIDIFRAIGGKHQILLYHSRGKEIESTIPDKGKTSPRLKTWIEQLPQNGKDAAPAVNNLFQDWRGQDKCLLKDVNAIWNSKKNWQHTWKLDYAAWASKTIGKNYQQWLDDGLKPVYLKINGIAVPGETIRYLVKAKTNLPATIIEESGSGMVEFENAENYIGSIRQDGLVAAAHVHVLEPWGEGENPFIKSIKPLAPVSGAKKGVVALEIEHADGIKDIVFYAPAGSGNQHFTDGLEFDGRSGMIRLNSDGQIMEARIIGGTQLSYQGKNLIHTPQSDFSGMIENIEGDISGDASKSSFAVKTFNQWPKKKVLADQYITVDFNKGKRKENYRIENIKELDSGLLEISLKGHPIFVDSWGEVKSVKLRDSRAILAQNQFIGSVLNKDLFANAFLNGSKIAFPELQLEFTLKGGVMLTMSPEPLLRYDIVEDVDLRKLGVKPGTKFAIYPDFKQAVVKVAGECGFYRTETGVLQPLGNIKNSVDLSSLKKDED
jgi:hypothetical protein